MRRFFPILFVLVFAQPSFAQMSSGLQWGEVKDMIQLCNSFTYLDLYDDDSAIIPEGYKKEFTSGVFGLDNMFQVYLRDNYAVMNFRGSTDHELSWLANFKSAMIPAKGKIKVKNIEFEYDMADDSTAAVHSGYMLGLAYLYQSVLMQIKYLNAIGVYDIYMTGHSQGGSLAALTMVYLDRLPSTIIPERNRFKLYAFANPMIGNKSFVDEYNLRYAISGWSFSVINPADHVPRLPMSYKEEKVVSPQGIASLISGDTDKREFLTNVFFQTFEKGATRYVQSMSENAEERISKELGLVDMPKYTNDINYYEIGDRYELPPVEYPKILKDSTILKNDSLLNVLAIDPVTGHFIDKNLYKKEPMFFQHKPHNYYLTLMKTYFRQEYDVIKPEILPENL